LIVAERLGVGDVEEVRLAHGRRERSYLFRHPSGAATTALPLVLELHGRGMGPADMDRWTGFGALAAEQSFALAMPAAVGEVWNDGRDAPCGHDDPDDVGFLLAVADDVSTRGLVDPARIYVVGLSNGAAMAGRLACEQPERFAAVAQVAGTAAVPVAERCRRSTPLPLLSIHGTSDWATPYAGGNRTGIRARILIPRAIGPAIGVDAWVSRWAEVNGTDPTPEVQTLGEDTTIRRWHGETPASDVVAYRIDGGGHTWPGNRQWLPPVFGRASGTFDATRVIWDFFAAHAKAEA
jgi:polyhydroxybutyrate depolymerase